MTMETSSVPSEHLLLKLHEFITGISMGIQTGPAELAETALCLLNTLPSAKDAILEYFCTVFHHSVDTYFLSFQQNVEEMRDDIVIEDSLLQNVYKIICSFVSSNPKAWAPIISEWSLDLLGQISVRNANVHKQMPLSDRLQLWMACEPTRTLIEINMQCLQHLMDSNTDPCVSVLLDKSITYSPYFDWVVAHVGSCFPQTVINKVLYCGLKDFCLNEQSSKAPKLNSVAGILAHLAGTHFNDVKTELYNLFMWSLNECTSNIGLEDKSITMQRTATVPFCLHICSLSPILLKALSENTVRALSVDSLTTLSSLASGWWCYFENGRKDILDLVLHLILNLENNISHFIPLLFETATFSNPQVPAVSQTAQELIELLISEIDMCLRLSDSIQPFVRCITAELPHLHPLLLSEDESKLGYVIRFFCVIGKHNSYVVSSSIAYLLPRSYLEIHLTGLENLVSGLDDVKFFGYGFSLAINNCKIENIEDSYNYRLTLWKNINKLLKWEQKYSYVCKPVLLGLVDNLSVLTSNLRTNSCHPDIAFEIASLICELLGIGYQTPSVEETFVLTEAIILFFCSCLVKEKDETKKQKYGKLVNKLLIKVSVPYPYAKVYALRLLVETALFPPTSVIFGATIKSDVTTKSDSEKPLWKINVDQGKNSAIESKSKCVFYAGIIGNGLKNAIINTRFPEYEVKLNTQHLINAMRSCCLTDTNVINLEPVSTLSLTLVQLVSTDVMFNGLPWPEEEFCKVTMERDLSIKNTFDTTPVLWSILNFVALQRPALCYCSVLLRAVVATVIPLWISASQGNHSVNMRELEKTTVNVLELMSLSQLLPPPLNAIQLVIPRLQPNEVTQILRECVWLYMRDHVPAPALFVKDGNGVMWRDPTTSVPSKQYTEPLRIIVLNNIGKLSKFYHKVFVSSSKE